MTDLKLLQCRLDGRYDVEDCLGRGSYAEIYVANDRAATDEIFRQVVIKALNVLLQGYQDPELERTLIQNFQNEAVALDRVRHPNIISRLGHGTAIDLHGTVFHYLVLEYLGGGDLAVLSRGEPLSLNQSLFYLQQVCAGLAHAHQSGVIHRDIKPQNLLLTADHQTVKIADFGVAKLEAAEGAITHVGTNIYAAPEHHPEIHTSQLESTSLPTPRSQLTPAADIYSLAKTAYTLICGGPPRRFAHDPITELPASISGEFWAPTLLRVLERATQTRPADRYQKVEEFWDELSDAALPPTRPLTTATAKRPFTSDLSIETVVVTKAPPQPQFETARELQHHETGNGAVRPRIVVPVANAATAIQPPVYAPVQKPGRVTVSVPRNGSANARELVAVTGKPRQRLRTILVSSILVLTFAGLLLATGAYVRSRIIQQTSQQTAPQGLLGREAVTTTDLNLRSGPGVGNDAIGLAENGSRVRVLSLRYNWCEVQVIQHGRPKDDPTSADRGWVNKTFLKFD